MADEESQESEHKMSQDSSVALPIAGGRRSISKE